MTAACVEVEGVKKDSASRESEKKTRAIRGDGGDVSSSEREDEEFYVGAKAWELG